MAIRRQGPGCEPSGTNFTNDLAVPEGHSPGFIPWILFWVIGAVLRRPGDRRAGDQPPGRGHARQVLPGPVQRRAWTHRPGSVLAGHPFTVDYAKEQAPPEVWHTAVFKRINLVLTSVWTVVFLLCAGLGLLSVQAHTKGVQDWLNWYIPIGLIIVGIRLNTWYPNYVRAQMGLPPRSKAT